jgi:gamma-glutamylcyclotransferase (GGCT)/AIG2-like uncharacterized protein YtfP
VTDLVFFYGTLMSVFERPVRASVDPWLTPVGRGSIPAALFDIGAYPGAIPVPDRRVVGEVHRMSDAAVVLAVLDEFEGLCAERPGDGLYTRAEVPVSFEDGHAASAWVYFYNRPLAGARRIESGDYVAYLNSAKEPAGRPEPR